MKGNMLNHQENQKKKSNSEILRNALVNSVCKTVCFDLMFTAAFEGYTGLTKYTLGKGLLAVSIYGVRELTNEFIPILSIPVGLVAGGVKGFCGLSMDKGISAAFESKDYLYNAFNNFSYETSKTFFDKTFFDDWVATPIIEFGESVMKKVIKGEMNFGSHGLKDKLLKDFLHITGISTLAIGIYVELSSAAKYYASIASRSMFTKYSNESFAILTGIGLIAANELFNQSNLVSYDMLRLCYGLTAVSYCFANQYKLGKRIVESIDNKNGQLFMMSTVASSALAACAENIMVGSDPSAVLGITVSSLLVGALMQKMCREKAAAAPEKLKIS